jgi:hypothetical protein
MKLEEFVASLSKEEPPIAFNPLLLALWYDGKGDWGKSHNIAQDIHTHTASHINDYIHRKEGDNCNADYWYSQAGVSRPSLSLEEEWQELVRKHLL